MLALADEITYMDGVDETDGGRPRAERLRTCIATRAVRPAGDLIRFVAGPDRAVIADLKTSLPGRGVWVTASMAAVREAMRRKAFARALKADVSVPADLDTRVDALLFDRAREALSIANKAGNAIAGFAKVESAIGRRPLALIHAAEAAADGCEKLDRKFRSSVGPDGDIVRIFTGDQLDLAFGRSNVVHAALERGPAATACLDRIRTLLRYRESHLTRGAAAGEADGRGAPAAGTDRE
jgi:predicted RNA-binding protein YlxR (DUF448 family)